MTAAAGDLRRTAEAPDAAERMAAGTGCCAGGRGSAALPAVFAPVTVPHLLQNRAPSLYGVPHFLQNRFDFFDTEVPQYSQVFEPACIFAPHALHISDIRAPLRQFHDDHLI